jgi:hypothetical protein
MANCYLCSAYLPRGEGVRMQCLTGERMGESRSSLKLFGSVSSSKMYGLRTVCEKCAAQTQGDEVNWGKFFVFCICLLLVIGVISLAVKLFVP